MPDDCQTPLPRKMSPACQKVLDPDTSAGIKSCTECLKLTESGDEEHQVELKTDAQEIPTFSSEQNFRTHEEAVHLKIKPHECQVCGKGFTDQSNLSRHMNLHLTATARIVARIVYDCDECNATYSREDNLRVHKKRMHSNIKFESEEKLGPEEGQISTDLVKDSDLTKDPNLKEESNMLDTEVKDSEAVHHKIKPLECQVCGRGFSKHFYLNRHMTLHLPATAKKKYDCEECNKTFTRIDNLRVHQKRAHSNIKFESDEKFVAEEGQISTDLLKDSDFTKDPNLKEESNIMDTEVKDSDLIPESNIKDESTFLDSEDNSLESWSGGRNVVEGENENGNGEERKLFGCDQCNRRFVGLVGLQRHQKKHAEGRSVEARNLSCEHCGKKFARAYGLEKHRDPIQ